MESRPLLDPLPEGHILVRHAWAGAIPLPGPLTLCGSYGAWGCAFPQ